MQVSILTLILSLVKITYLSRSNTLVLKSTDVTYSFFYFTKFSYSAWVDLI